MSSKEVLIKELDELNPLELLRVRSYVREIKGSQKKKRNKKSNIDMDKVRKSLSKIKSSLSDSISEDRADRI